MPPLPVSPSVPGVDPKVAEKLALFARRAVEAIFVGGADGRVEWANESACALCGARREDLIGRRLRLFPDDPDAQQAAAEHITERLAAGETARLEASLGGRDGRVLWIELRVTPVPAEDGAPGWVAVADDISERKRTAAALVESEEHYRRLVEDSPEPVAVHADGRLVYLNRAALALLGARSPEAVVGRPVFDFLHPDYHGLAAERILKMEVVGDPAGPVVERLLRVDGSEVDVELAATPVVWRGRPAIQLAGHALAPAPESAEAERARTPIVDFSSLLLELAPRIEDRIAPRALVSLDLSAATVALPGSAARLRESICAVVAQANASLPRGRGALCLRSEVRHLDVRELASFVSGPGIEAGRYLVFEAWAPEGELDAASRACLFESGFAERFPGRGPGLAEPLALARAHGGALRVQGGARKGLRITLALPEGEAASTTGTRAPLRSRRSRKGEARAGA